MKYHDDPQLKAHFGLIVAIIGAVLWLRGSLYPSYGWTVPLAVAAGWLILSSRTKWPK